MNLLFVTDLHGAIWKYERVFDVARLIGADAVVNGGDMFPHARDLTTQGEFIRGFLDEHLSRYDSAGIPYLCYPGNDDLRIHDPLLEEICERHPSAFNMAQNRFEIGGTEFIGMNWVVDYPFLLKDRCRKDTSEYVFQAQLGTARLSTPEGWKEIEDWPGFAASLPTIEEELARLPRPAEASRSIYIFHMPPLGLGLDECAGGARVGSRAIRDFLSKQQPRLSLHGHIHESPEVSGKWRVRLGETVCVQPGQTMDLVYVIIDVSAMDFDRRVESRSSAG